MPTVDAKSNQSAGIESWTALRRLSSDPKPGSSLGLLLILLIVLTVIRLAGLTFSVVDLFYDEAQYWSWAQDLAFGYFSKPPLLAWLLAGTRQVCGDAEWCLRAPSPLLYFATSLIVYFAGRLLYDERTGFWGALLTALTTGVVFSSRIISTDVPLLMFWSLALLAYTHLLIAPTLRWAVVLGISIGLGLLSKYAMIYFLAGVLLSALVSQPARQLLTSRILGLALVIGAIVVLPNVAWNIEHSFMTFRHTGDLVLGEDFRLSILRALEFVGSQFGVFGPVVFAAMIVATFQLRSNKLVEQDRMMIAFFVTPLIGVTIIAVGVHTYANWASVSAISGLILTAALLIRREQSAWLYGSIGLGLLMQAGLLVTDATATHIALPFLKNPNPYNRTLGWRAYAERVGQLALELGTPTIANDYRGEVAALRYYWRNKPVEILSWGTADSPEFDTVHPLTLSAPGPILFVTSCPDQDRASAFYTEVTYLGIFTAPSGATGRRAFFAFRLAKPRGDIGILPQCSV
jgi:4-amino-4-deoxy-L-arabinose transferase-like glycosyltransferase